MNMNNSNIPPRRGQIRSNPSSAERAPRTVGNLQPSREVFDIVVSKSVPEDALSLTPTEVAAVFPAAREDSPVRKPVAARTHKHLAKSAAKGLLLARAVQAKKLPVKKRRISPLKLGVGLLVVLILIATGYVGINTWLTHNRVKEASNKTPSAALGVSTNDYQSQEGKDRTPLPSNALATYTVAADEPRAIYINKINIAARVKPMALNPDNSVQAPINIFDSGWYTGSVKPGEAGAMLVDGHSTTDGQALFGKLNTLVKGDQIQIEKGDGTRLNYEVVSTETVDKDAVDMKKLLLPYGNALRALNLITCSGAWDDAENTLTQRTLVYTQQIE